MLKKFFSKHTALLFLSRVIYMVRFFSRVPVPEKLLRFCDTQSQGLENFAPALPALPIAGALIGSCGAFIFWFSCALSLPPMLAALLATLTLTLITGALHEDGLSDVADGWFGAHTIEARLAIMKDSRIGAFGTLALIFAIGLRVVSLAALHDVLGAWHSGVAIIISASFSRAMCVLPMALLPPASETGLVAKIGTLPPQNLRAFVWVQLLVIMLGLLLGLHGFRLLTAVVLVLIAGGLLTLLSLYKIAGVTGDVAGACQQISEIVFYLAFLVMI